MPVGYAFSSSSALIVKPGASLGVPDKIDDDSPTHERFCHAVLCDVTNIRCSILFHLLVPGESGIPKCVIRWHLPALATPPSTSGCDSRYCRQHLPSRAALWLWDTQPSPSAATSGAATQKQTGRCHDPSLHSPSVVGRDCKHHRECPCRGAGRQNPCCGPSTGCPWDAIPARILEIPDQFLFLRVYRYHRLPTFLKRLHLLVDMLKLCICGRDGNAFLRFPVSLQANNASPRATERPVWWLTWWPVARGLGEMTGCFCWSKAEASCGSPTCRRLQQGLQSLEKARVTLRHSSPPPAHLTEPLPLGIRVLLVSGDAARTSASPARMVGRERPVASATAVMPPHPMAIASQAAQRRALFRPQGAAPGICSVRRR